MQEFSIGSPDNSNYCGGCLYYIKLPDSILSKKIISYNSVSFYGIGIIMNASLDNEYLKIISNSSYNNGKAKFRFVLQS